MPLSEDIARSLVKQRGDELSQLPLEQRREIVNHIVSTLSEKSEDELISFISTREKKIEPELETAIEEADVSRGQAGLLEEEEVDVEELEKEAELQKLGVATTKRLPAGDIELGFGVDPVESLSAGLSKHFDKDVTVFKRGEDILYIDPETSEIIKVNRGPAGKIGEAIPLTGDVIGTIGGGVTAGLVTKHPAGAVAGETVGSGLGTGTAEYLRLYIGKALGAHDLSTEEMADEAKKKAGIAATTTAITGGIVSGVKGLRNFLKGRIFTKEEALKHGMTNQEADAVISEVNKIIGEKEGIKGTLFTRTGDVVIGAKEAEIRRNIAHAKQFVERDLSNQLKLTKGLDIVTEPVEAEGGKAVQEVVKKQIETKLGKAKEIVSKSAEKLDAKLTILSKTPKETVGEPTRKHLIEQTDRSYKEMAADWQSVRSKGGYNEKTKTFDIPLPIGKETQQTRANLARRLETATTIITKRGKLFAKEGKTADLADFNREISDLKAEVRSARKNKQFGTPQIRDMENTINAMEADRRLALIKMGRKDLLEAIEIAEKTTAKFHNTYNRSIVGSLTKKDETGVSKIKSKDFVDKILKGDKEEAKQLLEVIGGNPSLTMKWKEGIGDAFKKDVIDKNKPPKEWIDKHKPILEEFFTAQELKTIRSTGDLSLVVDKQTKQLERIISQANKKYGKGKLKSLDPKNIVKFVTGTGSFAKPLGEGVEAPLSKIRYTKGILKNHPEAWREFQREYSTSMRNAVMDEGKINPKALGKWVNTQSEIIKEVMGSEYFKNLKSVNSVAQLLKEKPKQLGTSEVTAGIIQAVRSGVAPPLTRRGRAFTAAVIFGRKIEHDVMAEALLNPSTMKKVAELAEHKVLTREAAELAVSLGLISEEE